MFKALVVDNSSGVVAASVRDLDEASLPPGNVTVAVEYSGINYKDGLVATGAGGLVKRYPHVPGIDFAGSVIASRDPAYKPGDKVVLTGWRVGEVQWGGVALTGRPETHEYVKGLGATAVLDRSAFFEPAKRPLETERWAGCIDSVGGNTLARVLAQTKYAGSVAAVGLAGGSKLEHTVIPFLLRGVNLLGIDSVMCPISKRIAAWNRLRTDLPVDKLEALTIDSRLEEVPRIATEIL